MSLAGIHARHNTLYTEVMSHRDLPCDQVYSLLSERSTPSMKFKSSYSELSGLISEAKTLLDSVSSKTGWHRHRIGRLHTYGTSCTGRERILRSPRAGRTNDKRGSISSLGGRAGIRLCGYSLVPIDEASAVGYALRLERSIWCFIMSDNKPAILAQPTSQMDVELSV